MVLMVSRRLRQVDVKAEHFERQVQRLESERDDWEKKYEVRISLVYIYSPQNSNRNNLQESEAKYRESKKELDELVLSMENM